MNISRQFEPWEFSDDEEDPARPTSSLEAEHTPVSAPAAIPLCSRSRSLPRRSLSPRAVHTPRHSPRQAPQPSHRQSNVPPPLIDRTAVRNQAGLTRDLYCRQSSAAPHVVDLTGTTNRAGLAHDPDWRQDQDWRRYEIFFRRDGKWWLQRPGIFDAPRTRQSPRSEGKVFRLALEDIRWALSTRTCEFKVGFATHLGSRWELYQQDKRKWTPRFLFILCTVPDRVSAGFLEAGLIAAIESIDLDHGRLNINRRNNDKGGTGPRKSETSCIPHYIYLAVRPCNE